MIKFFRKIRQQLLVENRPASSGGSYSKYLLYAIGEIALVMIGILLALQVNNWNEKRKVESQELKYLERLKIDLIQDTLYYNSRIEKLEKAIDGNTRGVKMAYQNQRNLKELQELLALYSYDSESLTLQNDTYNEMTNAGNFNIIENEDLKIAIIALYRNSSAAAKHIKEYNDFTVKLLTDLNTSNTFFKYYPYPGLQEIMDRDTMFNDSDWEFINDPTSYKFRVLENCMLTYLSKHTELMPYFKDLKTDSKSIINLIDDELKRRS